MEKRKILVTGSTGRIGRLVCEALGDVYSFSGIDRRAPTAEPTIPTQVADLADLAAIQGAFTGIDTVLHLGADPSPRASWESVLNNNLIGTRNVFEAARVAGVRRVVFASSNHAVGFYPMKDAPYKDIYDGNLGNVRHPFPLLDGGHLRPDSYYGVSKAFGESLGSYFHDAFGLSVICMRIGWVMTPDDPTFHPAALSLWLSHRDTVDFIHKCIEAPVSVGFAIVHGMSNNRLRIWESAQTQALIGYVGQDDAGELWTERPGERRSFI